MPGRDLGAINWSRTKSWKVRPRRHESVGRSPGQSGSAGQRCAHRLASWFAAAGEGTSRRAASRRTNRRLGHQKPG